MSSTLLVGTRKGLLTFERSGGTWKIARTDHEGIPIAYAIRDRRTGVTWASLEHGHWGAKMHRSDNGTDWEEVSAEYPDTAVDKEGEKVAGIITERDYKRKVILRDRSSKETLVATIMSRNLVTITSDQTIIDAMTLVTEKRCRHLPVFKDGQLDGILSIGDLVKSIIANQEFEIQVLQDYISGR